MGITRRNLLRQVAAVVGTQAMPVNPTSLLSLPTVARDASLGHAIMAPYCLLQSLHEPYAEDIPPVYMLSEEYWNISSALTDLAALKDLSAQGYTFSDLNNNPDLFERAARGYYEDVKNWKSSPSNEDELISLDEVREELRRQLGRLPDLLRNNPCFSGKSLDEIIRYSEQVISQRFNDKMSLWTSVNWDRFRIDELYAYTGDEIRLFAKLTKPYLPEQVIQDIEKAADIDLDAEYEREVKEELAEKRAKEARESKIEVLPWSIEQKENSNYFIIKTLTNNPNHRKEVFENLRSFLQEDFGENIEIGGVWGGIMRVKPLTQEVRDELENMAEDFKHSKTEAAAQSL